jgi:hypothetical protein
MTYITRMAITKKRYAYKISRKSPSNPVNAVGDTKRMTYNPVCIIKTMIILINKYFNN